MNATALPNDAPRKPKRCALCGGANLRVETGPVKPCKTRETAALYAATPRLPCGKALSHAITV